MKLLLILELLGLAALTTSGELNAKIFYPALFVPLIISLLWRLPPRILLGALGCVVLGAATVWFQKGTPPVLLAAHGVAWFHGLLWASTQPWNYRYWRIGLAFLDLLIAVSLSPGVHHFALALAFLFVSSVLGIRLQRESDAVAHGHTTPIPETVGSGIFLSLGALLVAAAIFPFLPRTNWSFLADSRRVDVGYTEEVRFSDWNITQLQDNPRVLMRFSWPMSADFSADQWRLIRGKVLEKFDGSRWRPGVKYPALTDESGDGSGVPVLATRESIGSDILPVPYGALQVELAGARSKRQATGEWVEFNPGRSRAEYRFQLSLHRAPLSDPPREVHRETEASSRQIDLARQLSRGATTAEAKVLSVSSFFRRGFTAQLRATDTAPLGRDPLDHFLFQSRAGHCEMFATAAAVLLRKMGVPSRLVVGFRPLRAPEEGLLEVKGRDSHAWLEFWNGKEWKEFDPTPVILVEDSPFGEFEDLLDQLNSLWYRWVLDFHPREISSKEFAWRAVLLVMILGGVIVILWWGAMLARIGWRRMGRSVRAQLADERTAFEREVGSDSAWMARYWELRFGSREPTGADREELRQWRRLLKREKKFCGSPPTVG